MPLPDSHRDMPMAGTESVPLASAGTHTEHAQADPCAGASTTADSEATAEASSKPWTAAAATPPGPFAARADSEWVLGCAPLAPGRAPDVVGLRLIGKLTGSRA